MSARSGSRHASIAKSRKRPGLHALFVVSIVGAASSPLRADTVTLVSHLDNTLYEDPTGAVSNGAGSAMFAGRNSAPSHSIRRALLAFDVAGAIPSGSAIEDVILTLFNDAANASPQVVSLHRVSPSWGEAGSMAAGGQGSGAPAASGDATWLHRYFDTSPWSAPGGDFTVSSSSTTLVSGPGFYVWPGTPMLVGDVQSFLDHPSLNSGWLLLGNEAEPGSAKRFATREAADPAWRPTLTVEFTPVPEPSSAILLLGALALPRLRRSWGTTFTGGPQLCSDSQTMQRTKRTESSNA